MFCKKCGNQINHGVKFCPCCGTPLETAAQPVTQPVAQPYVYPAGSNKKTKKAFSPIGTICFFAWILFLIFGNMVAESLGVMASNELIVIAFSTVIAIISGCDVKYGNEKYSKGLSIAIFSISTVCALGCLIFVLI